jgi:transposase
LKLQNLKKMKALNKHQKKVFMWYKVKELHSVGLNKSQIALELGIHRKTVRKYLDMSEESFHKWLEQSRNLPKKLQVYYDYVHNKLEAQPFLSAAQIEDRLKEDFSDFPPVHSKTVYNFTESIRARHGIKKQSGKQPRQYEKLPEPDYGAYAQADFGQYYMATQGASRKKVYFFVMVLCRSRQKFVYLQTTPFTSASTVSAHEKAFAYFEGQPRKIIYDQDRVLIVDENLGDVLLTQEFKSYCSQMDFEPVFCRKSDPESKGKVENVVKFVKYNLLSGRTYTGDDELNKTAQGWLSRIANGKEHAGTKKVPHGEWLIERGYLRPAKPSPASVLQHGLQKYRVRKDNTVNYKSNFYTLPLGTYQNQDSWVFLKETEGEIRLYDLNNCLLTIHPLCYGRGQTIRNADHLRDKSQSTHQLKEEVLLLLPEKEKGQLLIEELSKDKPRYLRDSLLVLKKHLPQFDAGTISQTVAYCLEQTVCNANQIIEIAKYHKQENTQITKANAVITEAEMKKENKPLNFEPEYSKISIYENIF